MDDTLFPNLSRRSAMQTGAFIVGGLLPGLSGAESSVPQTKTEYRARVYSNDFYPRARFRMVSNSLDYKPTVPVQAGEAFIADLYWNEYDTRIIRYENTEERVLFFPPFETPVDQDTVYRFGQIRSSEELASGIVTVGFGQVAGGDESDE